MAVVLLQQKQQKTAGSAKHGEPPEDKGWKADLKLGYAVSGKKSCLLYQDRRGPLFVQKPFYPEGPETCHTYIIHPPGGVVGGDSLGLEVSLDAGSQALITCPAAGKFYRSDGPTALQVNRLDVDQGAVLEWLPQETIFYSGARVRLRTLVRLAPGAGFMGWEMVCLGLPACGRTFAKGYLDQRVEIWREERPLLIEPLNINPADALLQARWAMGNLPVIGLLAATVEQPAVIQDIRRKVVAQPAEGLFAVTQLDGLTVCRYLGENVYTGLKLFRQAWRIIRPVLKGSEVCAPRIWAT